MGSNFYEQIKRIEEAKLRLTEGAARAQTRTDRLRSGQTAQIQNCAACLKPIVGQNPFNFEGQVYCDELCALNASVETEHQTGKETQVNED